MTTAPPEFPWAIVIAALGVGVNFIFNIVNFRRTSALKHRDVRLDEFKRLRTGVTAVLGEVRSDQQALRVLANSKLAKAKWHAEFESLNLRMGETYDKLGIALEDLTDSPYASGKDWGDVPSGEWDGCLVAMNGAYDKAKTLQQQKQAANEAAAHLGLLVTAVNDRLTKELGKHAPPPKTLWFNRSQ